MTNVNVTNFRKNIFGYMSQAIEYGEVVNVSTKNGNAVIMSEADYNALMETLHICSVPGLAAEIREAGEAPISECVDESEAGW